VIGRASNPPSPERVDLVDNSLERSAITPGETVNDGLEPLAQLGRIGAAFGHPAAALVAIAAERYDLLVQPDRSRAPTRHRSRRGSRSSQAP